MDGDEIVFPGDPSAKGYLVYNCRCTLVAALDGVDTPDAKRRAKDPKTGKYVLIKDMTYQEWAGWRAAEAESKVIESISSDARNNLKSIDASAIIKTKGGFSAFPKTERIAYLSTTIEPEEDFYDVAMHGSPRAVGIGSREANTSPRLLAAYIRSRKDYNGQDIRLLSCNTGVTDADGYCFAKELANALGVTVKAPNDAVFFVLNGFYVGVGKTGELIQFEPNQDRLVGKPAKKKKRGR